MVPNIWYLMMDRRIDWFVSAILMRYLSWLRLSCSLCFFRNTHIAFLLSMSGEMGGQLIVQDTADKKNCTLCCGYSRSVRGCSRFDLKQDIWVTKVATWHCFSWKNHNRRYQLQATPILAPPSTGRYRKVRRYDSFHYVLYKQYESRWTQSISIRYSGEKYAKDRRVSISFTGNWSTSGCKGNCLACGGGGVSIPGRK